MSSPPATDTEVLDMRGLKCPLPALLARRALARAPAGRVIEVLADDPLAPIDVPHMCALEGYEVVDVERQGSVARMRLRKPI
jgi:tRNA 2-thiouridine synthesizing protein A